MAAGPAFPPLPSREKPGTLHEHLWETQEKAPLRHWFPQEPTALGRGTVWRVETVTWAHTPSPGTAGQTDQEEGCPESWRQRGRGALLHLWPQARAPGRRERLLRRQRPPPPERTQRPSVPADPGSPWREGDGTATGVMWAPPSRRSSGPCTCARPGPPGSPGSARRSTSGTCTRTWSSA